MFDHHTVVYEFASGPRIYALCQTRKNCYALWDDIIMGTKGICYWTDCRIEGETPWRYEGPRNVSHVEEQNILISAHPRRPTREPRRHDGGQHVHGHHGASGVLQRPAGDLGTDYAVRV